MLKNDLINKTQLQHEKLVHMNKDALFYSDKATSQESKTNPEVEI